MLLFPMALHGHRTFIGRRLGLFTTTDSCGRALLFAPEELKNDAEIVLLAVTNNGDALQYASDELRSNTNIVNVAVTQNGAALLYAGDIMKNNGDVVLRALSSSPLALRMCSLESQSGALI